jgi:hypothetical protein
MGAAGDVVSNDNVNMDVELEVQMRIDVLTIMVFTDEPISPTSSTTGGPVSLYLNFKCRIRALDTALPSD